MEDSHKDQSALERAPAKPAALPPHCPHSPWPPTDRQHSVQEPREHGAKCGNAGKRMSSVSQIPGSEPQFCH